MKSLDSRSLLRIATMNLLPGGSLFMNNEEEIKQTFLDYRNGLIG